MNNEQFDAILQARLQKIQSILGKKAAEYARGDRLSNFKRAAATLQCTPEQACIGFWMKHVISLLDMIDDKRTHPAELWQEKIGDAINYLVLLEAIVSENPPA